MAKSKQSRNCSACSNSMLISASLVDEEEGRSISVVVCGHHKQAEIEKVLLGMHAETGLDIDIRSVELL
jgi:hypothetical protein